MRRTATVSLAALLVLGCGGGQTRANPFETRWHDESGRELSAFLAGWKPRAAPAHPPIAVAAAADGLVGMRLDDGARWRYPHDLEVAPVCAGDLVVAMGGGFLFALDGRTGALVWQLDGLGTLRGAADDGATTVVSIGSLSGKRSEVLAIGRSGAVVRQIDEERRIGAPAVIDGYAFLPLDASVIIFDLFAGREAARVVAQSPVTRAFAVDGELYFGLGGEPGAARADFALRFDHDAVAARAGGGTLIALPELPAAAWPADARWGPNDDGGPGAVAPPRSRILALPDRGRLAELMLVTGHVALGLDPESGSTRWAVRAGHPFVGGAALAGGFAVCDASGAIRSFEGKRGEIVARASFGVPISACDVAASSLPGGARGQIAPLWHQLFVAVAEPAPEALDVQLMLLADLARLPDAEARRALEDLAAMRASGQEGADVARARRAIAERAAELLAQGNRPDPTHAAR